MLNQEQIENAKSIARYYGFNSQSNVLVEEMSELTKEICKYNRAKDITEQEKIFYNIEEELADVIIMISQVLYLWADEKKVSKIIDEKILRQTKRISDEIGN